MYGSFSGEIQILSQNILCFVLIQCQQSLVREAANLYIYVLGTIQQIDG